MARKADPNRRATILTAAAQVFAEKGYAATRIIEVAQAAQVGKGTIYEYFSSKEALFFAVFEAMMTDAERSVALVGQALSGSFATRLEMLSDTIITTWLDELSMYGLVMEFWSATASSPDRARFKNTFQAGYVRLRKVVRRLIRKGQADGEVDSTCDAEAVAAALIGTWDALLLQAWLDPGFDAKSTARTFMAVILRGMAVPSAVVRRADREV
ncbi:MAG: TetR/AcrR family transcriptional regulator [Desulfosarcinaceae bacterium]|nr:TetR/AcrR family transcriptional regulator [Desulfosarcinaceae bacterium]